MRHSQGTVLLFLIGLITVMLITAFAFLRNVQISRGTVQSQRKEELARLAAEMGMQHAIAVCLHEYAMPNEYVDGSLVTGDAVATRFDGPHKNVFNIASPFAKDTTTSGLWKQRPQSFDMPGDMPLTDLFSSYAARSMTHIMNSPSGFADQAGFSRGYGRWFEANRWDFARTEDYDPATYDNLDLASARAPGFLKAAPPISPNVVRTPFPIVDPFEVGKANVRPSTDPLYNPLDNPLFLDAACRPVSDPRLARYRLRYAVSVSDMSCNLWANTDMPWLDDAGNWAAGAAAKLANRRAYGEAINSVGASINGLSYNNLGATTFSNSLQSVYLGYGSLWNSRFFQDGIPCDWPSRHPDGLNAGWDANVQVPMSPRMTVNTYMHSILGCSWMSGFDPARADGTRQWLGSPLSTFYDLGNAVMSDNQNWQRYGIWGWGNGADVPRAAKGSVLGQFMATPFGKPYDSGTGHPWALNILTVPGRTLSAMVSAYIPPAAKRLRVTSETQTPRWQICTREQDQNGVWQCKWSNPGYGDKTYTPASVNSACPMHGFLYGTTYYWKSQTWSPVPVSANWTIPAPGVDLFTDSFRPGGVNPFASHPAPANRNYLASAVNDRPWPRVEVADVRTNVQRYPGEGFFTQASEASANHLTRWASRTSRPMQVEDDGEATLSEKIGSDHLGRHIVFYLGTPGLAENDSMLTPCKNSAKTWCGDFSTHTPIGAHALSFYGAGVPAEETQYSGVGWTPPKAKPNPPGAAPTSRYRPMHTGEDWGIPFLSRDMAPEEITADTNIPSWTIKRVSTGGEAAYPNSYWFRVAKAFFHAVAITQLANLAWADPADDRSRTLGSYNLWTTTMSPNSLTLAQGWSGVPTYNTNPKSLTGYSRKDTTNRNPQASDFDSLEDVDRQFLANLGESFDASGSKVPEDVRTSERPPRYLRNQVRTPGGYTSGAGGSFIFKTSMNAAEYWVTNNIRTLLTPIDTTTGATLTAFSTDPQVEPPRSLWLLDEWNVDNVSPYPGTSPTKLARTRAKLMERMLNDWRMSFLGASKSYKTAFRPKDFDGDGKVFCSGYISGNAGVQADVETSAAFADVVAGGRDGPGAPSLTVFSITGSLTFTRSHQYKILVRGELVDNTLGLAIDECYLQGAILIDPDNDITRSSMPTGLQDSVLMLQQQLHSPYGGLRVRAYP